MNIVKISPPVNKYYSEKTKSINSGYKANNISFGCAPVKPKSKFFEPLARPFVSGYKSVVESLSKGIARLLETEIAYKTLEKTKRSKNLFNHLMTAGSVVLSGMYVIRTLTNKELDDKKRNTLAINQSLVFAVSTALCYLADDRLNNIVKLLANKFEAVNTGVAKMEPDKLRKCVKGIDAAKKIMIFDIIYRFMAPVFLTPVANAIGNKINEKQNPEVNTSTIIAK